MKSEFLRKEKKRGGLVEKTRRVKNGGELRTIGNVTEEMGVELT